MPTLELLFIIIISILVVSAVLSVIDWIYLAALSSKVMFLEREVEKKTLEFDTLKKERSGARQPPIHSASVIESTEPITSEASPAQQSIEDTIQIVRNVRGNFERTEHYTHDISGYPHEPSDDHQPSRIQLSQAAAPDVQIAAKPQVYTGAPMPVATATNNPYSTITPPAESTVLKLYSEIKRDADFQALWQDITKLFLVDAQPRIRVDLTGINFMYDKEMDYLEKIKYLLVGRGGSIELINCDKELHVLFNNRPQLHSIVQ